MKSCMMFWIFVALFTVFVPTTISAQEFVVAPNSIRLFKQKGDAKPVLHNGDTKGFSTLEILKTEKKWVKVRHSGYVKNSCAGQFPLFNIDLEFWVQKNELAKVTTSVVKAKVKGGKVTLQPGLPVKSGKALLPNKWDIPVKIPKSKLGWKFKPVKRKTKGPMSYLPSKKGFFAAGKNYQSYDFAILTKSMKKSGKKTTATVSVGCALVTGYFLDVEPPKHQDSAILGMLSGSGGLGFGGLGLRGEQPKTAVEVQKGAEVFWNDKTPAGKVRYKFRIFDPPVGTSHVCQKNFPWGKKKPSLELCVKTSDVKKVDPKKRTSGVLSGIGSVSSKKSKAPAKRVSVQLDQYAVAGGLDEQSISARLQKSSGALRHCQIKDIDKNRSTKNEANVSMTIGKSGKADRVVVKGVGPKIMNCLSRVFKQIRFKESDKATDVSLRLKLDKK